MQPAEPVDDEPEDEIDVALFAKGLVLIHSLSTLLRRETFLSANPDGETSRDA